jgi:hypothetical protein
MQAANHSRDLVMQVTFGEGVKRRIIVPADKVRDTDPADIQAGQEVTIEGKVLRTLAHHNGVTGVTVSFGSGMERQIVVPESALEKAQEPEIAASRSL